MLYYIECLYYLFEEGYRIGAVIYLVLLAVYFWSGAYLAVLVYGVGHNLSWNEMFNQMDLPYLFKEHEHRPLYGRDTKKKISVLSMKMIEQLKESQIRIQIR